MKFGRDALFLAAGAIGLATAVVSAIGAPKLDVFGVGAAAVVDGRPIPREAAARAVEALRNDKRNPVTPEDERAALERLIEEELLVQRGVAMGLAETDIGARKAIVQSVLQLAIAERAGVEPNEAELRAFHRDNAGYFAPAARVQASLAFVRAGEDVAARAEAAAAGLKAGKPASSVGDPQALVLPATPLGPTELRSYLGAALATSALKGKPGDVITQEGEDGWRVLRIDGWFAAPAPRYEAVASEVRAEWDRRADELAVRSYLERLKRRARITRNP
jgi:PPIC-type PPIASE domain